MPVEDDLSVALSHLGMLGTTSDATIRPVLLSVVVDLFVSRKHHARADVEIFAAMIRPLVEGASAATRRRVVDKLHAHPSAPLSLLNELLDEESLVEIEVFGHASLAEEQLIAAAESGPAMVAAAVARRPDLAAAVIDALLSRQEPRVVAALVDNARITFAPAHVRALVEHAAADPRLAERLLPRVPDPLAAAPLFPLVSSRARRAVLDNLRRQALGTRERVRPDGPAAALAARLDRLVLGGQWDGFDDVLCGALGYDRAKLVPLLHDGRGEVLAIVLAAAGVPGEVAARVFILGDPLIGRSVAAVRRLTGLVETVPPSAARRLLDAMQHGSSVERPEYRRPTSARLADLPAEPAPTRRDREDLARQRRRAG